MTANHSDILAGLNPEQREVVLHDTGPLLVGATAGSGKTGALTKRVAYLIRERGVNPQRILAVTFSNKAAKEMNHRLEALVPQSGARVGTFHSLGFQIMREEGIFKNYRLDDRDEFRVCVKDVLGYRGMRWNSADITVVLQFIGLCKANCVLANTEAATRFATAFHADAPSGQRNPVMLAEAYRRAETSRNERQLFTFDDMLLAAWNCLATDSIAAARWGSRWDYVLCDEAQDENAVQRELIAILSASHRNLMKVGDPGQAIYKFRGADPVGFLQFETQWQARRVAMTRNYRSGAAIIEAANMSLAAMAPSTHLGLQLIAERGNSGAVEANVYADVDDESEHVVADIVAANKTAGTQWGDVCVLVRTNAQTRALEEHFIAARVPYHILGGTNFYDRREVKDLLGYLRIAADRGTFDDVRRCINAPFRYLGKAFTESVRESAESQHAARKTLSATQWVAVVQAAASRALQGRQRESAMQWCGVVQQMRDAITKRDTAVLRFKSDADRVTTVRDRLRMGDIGNDVSRTDSADPETPSGPGFEGAPSRLLENLLDETQYIKWLTRDEGSESPENNRVTNVREMVRAAERFVTTHELLDFIAATTARIKENKETETRNSVVVMSIHKSKGLEFPRVYLIGCNEKILPHGKATDIDEERRLFYVAVTRARDSFHISAVRRAGSGPLAPSRFISEIGIKLRGVQ